MKKLVILLFLSITLIQCIAIKAESNATPAPETSTKTYQSTVQKNPKLVVGIVVDQMRYDYLIRFYNKYGNGGFKRLMNNGYNLKNVHFNYIPTYTAVGHTSIYTGTTPVNHGIISNNWYDKVEKKSIFDYFQNYKHFQPFLPDSSLYPRISQLISQNFKDYLNQYYTLYNYLIFLNERSYYLQIYLYFSY